MSFPLCFLWHLLRCATPECLEKVKHVPSNGDSIFMVERIKTKDKQIQVFVLGSI